MRRWGWLELGFTKDYLGGLFQHLGLEAQWMKSDVAFPHSQVIRLSRRAAPVGDGRIRPADRYQADLSDGIDFSKAGFPNFLRSCTGVSLAEGWGRWSIGDNIQIRFEHKLPAAFDLVVNLKDVFGPNVRKRLRVQAGLQSSEAVLDPIEARSSYQFRFEGVDSDLIQIFIPHPFRFKDMPELQNEDARKIGIALVSILVRQEAIAVTTHRAGTTS